MYNFIHVPKTGGVSFKSLTKDSAFINYCGHVRAQDMKMIAIVRNPYSRIVSAYYYILSDDRVATYFPEIKEVIAVYNDINDMVMNIEKDCLIEKVIHLKSQSYWLCHDDGRLLADLIFKIEEPESIDEFIHSLWIEASINDYIENTSDHPHFEDILTPEAIAEINRLYERDFELFNYRML